MPYKRRKQKTAKGLEIPVPTKGNPQQTPAGERGGWAQFEDITRRLLHVSKKELDQKRAGQP